jgi:hypothetical protein
MTPFRWSVGHVPASGLSRRVNGQHSSEVFLGLTPEEWAQVVFPVTITWEEYACESTRDLAVLFEQFDPYWSSRNREDLIGAHLGIHDDLRHAIDRYVATRVTAGVVWYREKVLGVRSTAERQFSIIHEHHDIHAFLTWCGSFLQKHKTAEMFKKPILAAVYHTARDGDEDARGFWKRVASGKAPLDADTTEYKLADILDLAHHMDGEWPAAIKRQLKGHKQHPSDAFALAHVAQAA